ATSSRDGREVAVLQELCEKAAICGNALARAPPGEIECGARRTGAARVSKSRRVSGMAKRRVTCDDCYFRQHTLCAIGGDEPCATFRPDRPEGLQPPRQLRFA